MSESGTDSVRMVVVEGNPGAIRDVFTNTNYHLQSTEEAIELATMINAYHDEVVLLSGDLFKPPVISDEKSL